MKYMGSKAYMLNGFLGEHLLTMSASADRVVDLFSGSGAVALFVAEQVHTEVVAVDQMLFPTYLSGSVLARQSEVDGKHLFEAWLHGAVASSALMKREPVQLSEELTRAGVEELRASSASDGIGFISKDYGGHYFSPRQAFWFDLLLAALPQEPALKYLCLASLIRVASDVSASPGHTAQPFQPTPALLPHIRKSWSQDVLRRIEVDLAGLSSRYALERGVSVQSDAVDFVADGVEQGDLVFLDPPYSEAQYGRFYHVLEGIARQGWGSVSGAGRAPQPEHRANSSFSRRQKSRDAMRSLLFALAEKRAAVVITYPAGERSNGLQWKDIVSAGESAGFRISAEFVPMTHSTLGGSNRAAAGRRARHALDEVVLTLRPSGGSLSPLRLKRRATVLT